MDNKTEICIVGSGPAGYTAAIYGVRAGRKTILVDGPVQGGQLTQTTVIENFPGFPEGREGFDLMDDMRAQAERVGATMMTGEVTGIDFDKRPFVVHIDSGETIEAQAVIIATGATAKYLGLPDEKRLAGKGVSACATCDGFFFKGKDVAVVGGGDTAAEEALYLAGLANKVYMIVRRDVLRASEAMCKRVFDNPKITVLFKHQTVSLEGEDKLEAPMLVTNKVEEGETMVRVPISGFFLAIGHKPNTEVFPEIETDGEGYIKTSGKGQTTNIEGVFAAGDVCDPTYRQAITAAASGCRAAIDADRYLRATGR